MDACGVDQSRVRQLLAGFSSQKLCQPVGSSVRLACGLVAFLFRVRGTPPFSFFGKDATRYDTGLFVRIKRRQDLFCA